MSYIRGNQNTKCLDIDTKSKLNYLYDEIMSFENKIPSIEKMNELQKIEIELETNCEDLYELGNYFDPVFIRMKNLIYKNNVLKLREKNRKKRAMNL